MSIKAMKQWLDALETPRPLDDYPPILKAYAKTINDAITSLHQAITEAEKQEPVHELEELRYIDEDDCLLDVDEKAWRLLVENRGGCRCFISAPCGACSDSISEEELNEIGYTYTHPQPNREWVGLTLKEILDTYRGPDGSDYVEYARGLEAKLKEKNIWTQ